MREKPNGSEILKGNERAFLSIQARYLYARRVRAGEENNAGSRQSLIAWGSSFRMPRPSRFRMVTTLKLDVRAAHQSLITRHHLSRSSSDQPPVCSCAATSENQN